MSEFISTNKFEQRDGAISLRSSEYFTARNEMGQITAQIIRTDSQGVPSAFWGYLMLKPGASGKSQSGHLRRFGPFDSFDEAKNAIEADSAEAKK